MPVRIFTLRHGESLGNVEETVYARLGDHRVPATPLGRAQGRAAGEFLNGYYKSRPELAGRKIRIFYSPFLRTEETKDEVVIGLGEDMVECARQDYLLVEQNFGLFSHITDPKEQKRLYPREYEMYQATRRNQGKFYAVPPLGESRLQVTMRTRLFKETLMRDVAHGIEDFLIVAHGVTVRSFVMDFLHKPVQWFEDEPNPGNCDITLIEKGPDGVWTSACIYKNELLALPDVTPAPAPTPSM